MEELLTEERRKTINIEIIKTLLFEHVRRNDYKKITDILFLNFYDNILEVLYYFNFIEKDLILNNGGNHSITINKLLHLKDSREKDNKDELINFSPNVLKNVLKNVDWNIFKIIRNENDKKYFQEIVYSDLLTWCSAESQTSGKSNTICHTLLCDIIKEKNITFITENFQLFSPIFERISNINNQFVFFGAFLIENFSKQSIGEFLEKLRGINKQLYFFINTTL